MSDEWDRQEIPPDPHPGSGTAVSDGRGTSARPDRPPTLAETRWQARLSSGLGWLAVCRAILRGDLPAGSTPADLHPDDEGRLL